MELNDDFMSLQEFKDDEKTIFEYLDAGMRKKLSLYALSHHSGLIDLSPVNIQAIKKYYPNKVRITLEKKPVVTFNECTGRTITDVIHYNQVLSYSELWFKESEASKVFEQSVKHTLVNETEKSTMLKLILGMAMGAYGFQPGERNTATGSNKGSIKADLQKFGLSIDEETVRKYLNEAAAMYPSAQITQKNKILQN